MGKLFTEDQRDSLLMLTEAQKLDIAGDWIDKYYDAMEAFETQEATGSKPPATKSKSAR